MAKKVRIELTFASGKFIAFPDVHEYRALEKDGAKMLRIVHGSRFDKVYANIDKLDFFEIMEIEE